jgi:pyruvate,water dikinase
MIAEPRRCPGVDLAALPDEALAAESIGDNRSREMDRHLHRAFIPLAHGIRLFGQTYNDALRPRTPTSSWTSSAAPR